MKKTIVIVMLALICVTMTNAQYKVNKTKYSPKQWTYQLGDPYNPALCGVVSLLVPGVGQMIAGEGGRGAAFLGGYVGCWVIYGIGLGQAMAAIDTYGEENYEGEGIGLMAAGLISALGIGIWSIVDAVQVAKVNNLAWRDQNNQGYNLKLEPYVSPLIMDDQTFTQGGLSLKITF
jgi:hypothetical protein